MMQEFISEVLPSGRVVSCSTYAPEVVPFPIKGGSFIRSQNFVDPSAYRYDGTEFVPLGASPSKNHVFDYEQNQWVDPRTLDDLKALKRAEINQHRDQVEFGPFEYNGMAFDGDVDAQRRLAGYISVSKSALAQGEEYSREFILADNTVVTLQANDFVAIELAKIDQVAAAFAKAILLKQQIEQATSKEELEAIVWE